MPKFMDFHAKMPHLPAEALASLKREIQAGKPDQFGVKPINAFLGADGRAYCLTEAPNAEAVCASHLAKGLLLGKADVVQVNSVV